MYRPPAPNTCVLYLLRHGATENNLCNPPILQGRGVNLGLSLTGRSQAALAADALAGQKIAAVYSSTLLRSRETAAIVAKSHGLETIARPELVEVDVGRWEMRSWVDIAREEPEAYRLFQGDPGRHGYAGGENMAEVQLRVAPILTELMSTHLGEQIVVVGHNVVNRAYLAGVLELPLARARHLHQENCCINILEFRDGQTKLVTLNAVAHLFATA